MNRNLVVAALVLVVVSGWLVGARAQEGPPLKSEPTSHAAAIAKWQALVPAINKVLEEHNLKCHDEWVPRIVDAADFSSADDVSVALVDYCNGGAYTIWIVAMNLEDGRPVLSRFRNANGQDERVDFASGSSVMHSVRVELVPGKNAIYDFHWDHDETGRDCGIKAYVWNTKTKTFRFETELSKHATQSRCSLVLGLPEFIAQKVVAETACRPRDFDPSATRGDQAEGDWLSYRNGKNGLSFRYPSSMWVKELDPTAFGMDKDDIIVDLHGKGMIVRFSCATGEKTPQMAVEMAQRFREQTKYKSALTSIQIDRHEALAASVRGGGGSCLWGITILQPRLCDISPMGEPGDSSSPLHDGYFPLLSIIQTMHFAEVPNR
jgi:hypothetical protein